MSPAIVVVAVAGGGGVDGGDDDDDDDCGGFCLLSNVDATALPSDDENVEFIVSDVDCGCFVCCVVVDAAVVKVECSNEDNTSVSADIC